jgi:hypothetical protein
MESDDERSEWWSVWSSLKAISSNWRLMRRFCWYNWFSGRLVTCLLLCALSALVHCSSDLSLLVSFGARAIRNIDLTQFHHRCITLCSFHSMRLCFLRNSVTVGCCGSWPRIHLPNFVIQGPFVITTLTAPRD